MTRKVVVGDIINHRALYRDDDLPGLCNDRATIKRAADYKGK